MSKQTILGLDPGSKNFAATVIRFDAKSVHKVRIVRTKMIKNTLQHMRGNSRPQLVKYASELRKLMKVDALVAERYMARGVSRSTTGETVGIMIGLLFPMHRDVTLVPAALWKNAVNRVFELDLFYKCCSVPPHIVDSTLLAAWHAQMRAGLKPFAGWSIRDLYSIGRQLGRQYRGHKRNIRDIKRFTAELKKSFR